MSSDLEPELEPDFIFKKRIGPRTGFLGVFICETGDRIKIYIFMKSD